MQDAQLPEALAPLVVGFVSLSDIPSAHPDYRKAVPPVRTADSGASPLDTVSTSSYAVGPQDFYTIYNESPLLTASTPINGSGVTIALLEESAINTADVTYFRNMFGVTPATPVSLVVQTGNGCTAPGLLASSGEEGEAVLDVEWAGAVAPGANLIFMQCATVSSPTPTLGVLLSAEAAVESNVADILSLSYGEYEGYQSAQDVAFNNTWEQAASQGQTVVVSAGDSGTATEDGNFGNTYAHFGITVSSFSSTAWNVSAGGTDFQDTYNNSNDPAYGINTYWNSTNTPTYGSARSYIPETTWNGSCASSLKMPRAAVPFWPIDDAVRKHVDGAISIWLPVEGPQHAASRPSPGKRAQCFLPATSTYANRLQPDVSLFASNNIWEHDLPSYESDKLILPFPMQEGRPFVAPQLAGVFAPHQAEDRRTPGPIELRAIQNGRPGVRDQHFRRRQLQR